MMYLLHICNCRILETTSVEGVKHIASAFNELLDKMEAIINNEITHSSEDNMENERMILWCQHTLDTLQQRTAAIQQEINRAHNISNSTNSDEAHIKNKNEDEHKNGLMGLMTIFGRFSYVCLSGLFVPSLAFVCDFFREVPDVLTTALVFPYLLISFEIIGFSYFILGQTEQSSSYFLMTSLLNLCETVITNSTVLKYCGMLIIAVSIGGIMNQNAMMKQIMYD